MTVVVHPATGKMLDTWEAEGGRVQSTKLRMQDLVGNRHSTKIRSKTEKYTSELKAPLSLTKIRAQQTAHNKLVKRKMYQNVTIPIVYSGHNTK